MSMDRKIEKRFWTQKRIIQLSSLTLIILALLYFVIFGDTRSKLNVQLERIAISEVTREPFQVYIPLTGTVLPLKSVYIDAAEGGRIDQVIKEAGSMVNKGDTIMVLTNPGLLMGLMDREAQMFEQRNNLRNTRVTMEMNSLNLEEQLVELGNQIAKAERLFERNKKLMEKNLISREEFEESRDNYDYLVKRRELNLKTQYQDSVFRSLQIEMLESSVARIDANLEVVRQNLANLAVRAPISGQLTQVNAEIGETKRSGDRLGQIDVLDGFKVRAQIDEYYISQLEVGLIGDFELGDSTYNLKVTKIFPEVRDGRFEVEMEFPQALPRDIRRGQTVHIKLALGSPSVCLQVDRGGFQQNTGGNWAYVLDKTGHSAVRRNIRLGRMNPKVIEVLEGLSIGDKVITSSYDGFGDAEKIILK